MGSAGMAQGVSGPAIPGTVMNVSGSGVLEVLDSTGNALVHFEALITATWSSIPTVLPTAKAIP